MRKRRDGLYDVTIEYDPMDSRRDFPRPVMAFKVTLDSAVAHINAYVTAKSGVYFMGER